MIVKSFGCSFTWGTELPDEVTEVRSYPSNLTWPALLAQHIKKDYQCFAWAGIGNFFIANSVLTHSVESCNSNDLFIINWTYIDRFDYLTGFNATSENVARPWKWETCRPDNNADFFKKYHSEIRDKIASLQLIKLCIDTLLQSNIRFIMTTVDDLIFDRIWNTSVSIKFLQDYIEPYFIKFNNQTFLQYADSLGHVRTPGGHLNEHAHRDIAKYVITSSDIQSIVDC